MKKLLLLFLLPFLSTPLLAEGFNDNYFQVGYSTSNYKFTDTMTSISGSAEFGNNYSISGEYFYEKGDWNDPGEYEKLKIDSRSEKDDNRKVYRPWGYFDSIDYGEGFQVKRLFINPGAKLSLQKHQKRAEHWVVVKGIASVTCGEKKYKLTENQSTYIPKGEIHRLENREKNPLEIIEIQTGNYLGEDDIIRLEDDYERS